MHCPRCNAEVDPQAKFCPECGAALNAADTEPAAALNPAARGGHDKVEEERDLWEGSYSGKSMIGVWILLAVVSVAVIAGAFFVPADTIPMMAPILWALILLAVVWLCAAAVLVYRRASVHYRVTTQRLIHRRGIVRVSTDRIELIDVDDISYTQGLVERMLGVGTVLVHSSDRSHPELKLRGIDGVQKVADVIDDARRTERRRRGLHIETI